MEFKLPDIGEGVHEGEITKWLVKAGDKISADQPMVEVMTDKATVEIPSPVTGTVDSLFAKEGETIQVGKVLLKINENGKTSAPPKATAAAAPAPKTQTPKPEPKKVEAREVRETSEAQADEPESETSEIESEDEPSHANTEAEVPFHVLATPATRKLARDLKMNLGNVSATGPNGRVTKEDVRMAYEGQQAAAPRSSHPSTSAKSSLPATSRPTQVASGAVDRVPLKGIRRKISEAMAHSKRTAAHFTYVDEVDMTAVVAMRKAAADEAKRRDVKLTFLPFIMKALVPALKEFPYLNASLDDERQEIILKHEFNFGVATDTPNGLMVPVIKGCDRKSIWDLAEEIATLSDKARNGKSAIDELKGGTFTLTNAGSIGGVFTTPVINHPEVAILGVNAIRKRPMVVDDEIVIRDMMYLSMSVDHRVVDGADAARFVNRLIYFLSEPTRLVFA